jgi:hypothetical protein
VLTPASLKKAWVQTEIDAGFINAVGGKAKFIGIRCGIAVDDLSPFLRTLHCPEVRIGDPDDISKLIADIWGASRKPPLGARPKFAQTVPAGLEAWSQSAIAVAKHLVCGSKFGCKFDPQVTVSGVAQATGLPEDDVRLGVLDLEESRLIERSQETCPDPYFRPNPALFVVFDKPFLGIDSKADAVAICTWLVNKKIDRIEIEELARHFPDWSPWRINSALNYLEDAKHIKSYTSLGSSHWTLSGLRVTDNTRRFVRDNA